jgi:outer membrane protein W
MKKNLKKIALIIALATVGTFGATAQSYDVGNKLLNVGVGLGSTLSGSGINSTLPPIGLSFEYGFTEKISGGAYVGYSSASQDLGAGFKANYTYTILGARGSYHFATSDKLDPYFGLTLGYNVATATIEPTSPFLTVASASAVLYSLHLGSRYYFTDNIGAFAELGYGIAYLQLGVAVKF